MANKIQVKRSAVANKVPTTADLDLGEIAINTNDGKMYIKKDNGTASIVQVGYATGNVVGPASATDNAVARFDTTTGKLIQNSVVTIDDTGSIAGILSEQYNTASTPPAIIEGLEAWDSGNGTLEVGLVGGVVSYKYGQQEYVRAYNGSGLAMTKGQVVYIVGAQGNRVDVRLAKADAESTSAGTIGFVAEAIANGAEGWVQVSGSLYKLDTSALTAGQALYLSAATAGAYTVTRPTAPNHTVVLGWVQRISATVGSFYVKVDNGYELDELHNVLITSAASGNTLIYDATAGVWKNANLTAGTGVSVTNGAGSITIANTGVTSITGTASQITASASTGGVTLSLPATINVNTSGNAANVTGTVAVANGGTGATTAAAARTNLGATTVGSNMFTLTNPSAITFPRFNADNTVSALDAATFRTAIGAGAGTVTSVTGTAPVASSGGATPAISLAAGYGDTQNPYASKTANYVLAAPNGSAGVPTFRALVAADVPTLNQNTTGTAANVTGTVAVANGGTGATTAATARSNLGATTVGGNMFTLTNPSAITFPRFNADNTVSALDAATFRTAIGAGTGSGTVTSVTGTAPVASSGGATPAISLAAGYGDTQNPFASKTANYFLAAPNGSAGAPTFRAIVAADVPTLNQNTTGSAATLTTSRSINAVAFNGSADITIPRVKSIDDRATAPADGTAGYATFGFGSWANNSTSPYADNWILRSYTDATGGNDNMVSFRKDALGMRVWQQAWGSATNFATYKDVAWTDGTNATGTWSISTSGSAATLTTTRTLWGQNFNGSANVTGAMSSVTTLSMSGQLTNTVANGTAPMVITSTSRVANLNAATSGTADTSLSLTFSGGGAAGTVNTALSTLPTLTTGMALCISDTATPIKANFTPVVKSLTSTDSTVTITETSPGVWDLSATTPTPPGGGWYTLVASSLTTTLSMPSNWTSTPSGTYGAVAVIASNTMGGSSWGSSLYGPTWQSTSMMWSPNMEYYSNYWNWSGITNPATVWSSAPSSGFMFSYMQYPPQSTNTSQYDVFGNITSWSNMSGSMFSTYSPFSSGTNRTYYLVLMIQGNNTVTANGALMGVSLETAYDSWSNYTYVFFKCTDNASVGNILTGSTVVSWMNFQSYYGHAWYEYT